MPCGTAKKKKRKSAISKIPPCVSDSAPDHSWKQIAQRSQVTAPSNKLVSTCRPSGGDHPQTCSLTWNAGNFDRQELQALGN